MAFEDPLLTIMTTKECVFCRTDFPLAHQLISDRSPYWTIVHDLQPMGAFHCLVVSKKHYEDIGASDMETNALSELGGLLHALSAAIQECSQDIARVNILSMNSGEYSKHLHFHVVPIYKHEKIRKVDNTGLDGSGLTFLSRKEIVVDCIKEYIAANCGKLSEQVSHMLKEVIKEEVRANSLNLQLKLDPHMNALYE